MLVLKWKKIVGDGTKDEGRREKTGGRRRDFNNQVNLTGGLETHNEARPCGMGIHDPAFKIQLKQGKGKNDSKPKLIIFGRFVFLTRFLTRYTQTTGSLPKVEPEHSTGKQKKQSARDPRETEYSSSPEPSCRKARMRHDKQEVKEAR